MIADLPALHVIQLAALCKVPDLQSRGYRKAFGSLFQDLGVFIECLGCSVQGTVLCVVSDNLAAHSLAGFMQSFIAGHVDFAMLHKTKFSLMMLEMVNLV